MGCDIHMVLERKIDDQWVGLHAFQPSRSWKIRRTEDPREIDSMYWGATDRDYDLFGDLAQVRSDGPTPPKGLPDDISLLAQHVLANDSDCHSFTWYTLSEALPIFTARKVPDMLLGDRREGLAYVLFGVWDDVDSHRLIIGFDN